MKVILINGSPHKHGCTYEALRCVANELQKEDIQTEFMHIGGKSIQSCLACGKCAEAGRCLFDDVVNEFLQKAAEIDGFVIGSPVHYAGISGALKAFLDRAFFAGREFAFKPGAVLVSARRAGTTAALDQLNKYLAISNMPIVTSQYWNMVHGMRPEEVSRDCEGVQTIRNLGRNLAWLMKCLEAGKEKGIRIPSGEEREWTNFIRQQHSSQS